MSVKSVDGGKAIEFQNDVKVIGAVKEPTLASDQFDPFAKHKTEPDKYYYRALNVRPANMRVRQAEGFETIEGSEYGDLILGRLPIEEHNRRLAKEDNKIKQRTTAAVDRFKQEAEQMKVKTFEE